MVCFVLLYHIVNSSNFPTTYNRLTWSGPHSDMIDCCNSANTFLKLFEVLLLLVLVVLLGYLLVNWLSMISIPFQQEFDAWIFIFMVHRVLLFLQLIKRSAICAMEHKIKKKSHGTPVVPRQCGIFYCVTALLDGASKISKLTNKMFDFTSAT